MKFFIASTLLTAGHYSTAAAQQLVSFCQSLLALEQASTILIDDNDIPIEIDDLQKFADTLVSVYWKAANRYMTEYNKLKSNRTVEGIVDL